jgi:Tfp pilus assembly protein PilN
MRAVNLLPRDEVVRSFEAKRGVVFGGAFGAALVTAALVSMSISAGGAVGDKQAQLDTLHAEIAAVPAPVVKDTSTDDALAAVKTARIGALSAALTSRVAWDRVLRQVSLVLPEDVWLTNLSADAPQAATPVADAASSGFALTGSTYSLNGVARFLSRLSVIPDLKNVRLQSSASQLVEQRDLVQFTILADVRSPGEAAKAAG